MDKKEKNKEREGKINQVQVLLLSSPERDSFEHADLRISKRCKRFKLPSNALLPTMLIRSSFFFFLISLLA